ncbi:MAG TPA: DegT/DnrJ/EryC1/StrS family aminotransferase [Puia sp.]|nr:DegT/DnrJ/EryC1/StrS family aminotransferase [Puia sp.]
MKVPFADLNAQYRSIKPEIDSAIASVIAESAFIGGHFVKDFEDQFAKACGVKHVIGCGNGTDTLYVIMKMLGIGSGDEVITPANSWISSSESITQAGANPVFVDADADYFSLDESLVESKITNRTKAVIAVHLHGQMCEMDKLKAICEKHGLFLIEDCAQAHFSEYGGIIAGLFGAAGSFSFYPGKNLGAYGDAGCIITNDDKLAERCRMYARHGALIKHQHIIEGVNSRLDGLQAAILSAKLPHLGSWTAKRIECAAHYNERLVGIGCIVLPAVRSKTKHTFHLYVIRAERRDDLAKFLQGQGIETSVHYPTPLPFLPAYSYMGHKRSDFPVAAKLQEEILSLPIYPEMQGEMIDYVAENIKNFYRN